LNAASTAAAAALSNSLFRLMHGLLFIDDERWVAGCMPARRGENPHGKNCVLCERVGLLEDEHPIRAAITIVVDAVDGRGRFHRRYADCQRRCACED
jgi:hypothetical protein